MTADPTGWDVATPADGDALSAGAQKIRDVKLEVETRLNKEHVTFATASAGGEHLAGSAKAYYNGSAPTKRPDTTTNLGANDAGRLWIDGGVLKYWDGSAWQLVTVSGTVATAILSDTRTSGTNAGTATSGSWFTRTIQSESDPNGIVTLSANRFTLGAGTYYVRAFAVGYRVTGHQIRLQNITAGTTNCYGTSEVSVSGADYASAHSELNTILTPAGSTVYELQHRVETTSPTTGGQGRAVPAAFSSTPVYAFVIIQKLA